MRLPESRDFVSGSPEPQIRRQFPPRVTTFTTIAGAEAAVEGMRAMDNLDVISVQEMHAQLAA